MNKAILFDFDGTLIHTNELIFKSFEYVVQKNGVDGFDKAKHIEMLGKPLTVQFEMICKSSNQSLIQSLVCDFRNWYAENYVDYARAVNGVEEALNGLKEDGCKLGLVTNNSREGLRIGFETLRIKDFFDVIITNEDVASPKPSPEGIIRAMNHIGVKPHQCAYIGDAAGDIKAAWGAGIGSALVSWTELTDEQIESLVGVRIVESPYRFKDVQIGDEKSCLPVFEEMRFFRNLTA